MTEAEAREGFVPALEAQLVAGAHRRRQRRRTAMRGGLVAAAIALVLVVAAPGTLPDGQPGEAFAVQPLPDGSIRVTIAEQFDDPFGLERALREAGVDVRIVREPGSPSVVGRLSSASVSLPEGAEGVEVIRGGLGHDAHAWDFVVDPRRFTGNVELRVPRPAQPGESVREMGDVFLGAGEPLQGLPCAAGWPLSPEVVERAAGPAGLRIVWYEVFDFDGDGGFSYREARQRPEGRVFTAHLEQPGVVGVIVLPGGLEPVNVAWWDAAPDQVAAACTPELADRWRPLIE